MEELETFKSEILKLYEMDFTKEELSKMLNISIENVEKIIDEHSQQTTFKYLERFFAEEGNSTEDRFKSDLEEMRRIGFKEGFKKSYVKACKESYAKAKKMGIE